MVDWAGLRRKAMDHGLRQAQLSDQQRTVNALRAIPSLVPQMWNNMSGLDKAALVTSPVPVLGDIIGSTADAKAFADDPSAFNGAMLSAGVALPFAGGILAGKRALNADPQLLKRAEELFDAGAAREKIWQETGWFKAPDGQWKFEIDDSQSVYDPEMMALEDGYRVGKLNQSTIHPDLFQAYPEFKDIESVQYSFRHPNLVQGQYRPASETLGKAYPPSITQWDRSSPSTNLHEIQHAIQEAEGMARGGSSSLFTEKLGKKWEDSPESVFRFNELKTSPHRQKEILRSNEEFGKYEKRLDALDKKLDAGLLSADSWDNETNAVLDDFRKWSRENLPLTTEMDDLLSANGPLMVSPDDQYRALAGEAEARAVQARMNLTPEQRAARPFWEDYDIPESEQIVRFGDGPAMSLPMDEASRMERMEDMGHERGFWRGGREAADGPWYARNEEAAREYGERWGEGSDVREYSLKMDNTFSFGKTYKPDDLDSIKAALEARGYDQTAKYLKDIPDDYGGEAPGAAIVQMVDIATGGNSWPVFNEAGFDVVDMGKELVVTHDKGIVRDAAKAAYDGSKKTSPDIFAGLAAPAVGVGLLSSYLLNEEENPSPYSTQ